MGMQDKLGVQDKFSISHRSWNQLLIYALILREFSTILVEEDDFLRKR
jgi:hypothetical protein